MENLNAENIVNEIQSLIKALKDCGGWVKRGKGEGWFNHEILSDALDIITSQEQKIKELTEENERLHGHLSQLKHRYDICKQNATNAKADTVREFAERFKELMRGELASCGYCNAVGYWSVKAVKDNIDRIANEILNKNTEE